MPLMQFLTLLLLRYIQRLKPCKVLWPCLLLAGCRAETPAPVPENNSRDVGLQIKAAFNQSIVTSGRRVKCTSVFLLPRDDEGRVFSGTADFSNGSQKPIEVHCDPTTGQCAMVKP